MKRISKLAILLLLPGMLQGAPSTTRIQETVETQLRSAFNLIDGPATQFVSFHIPHQGYFVVLSTDFGMAGGHRTPFGTQPTASRVPAENRIRVILRQALLDCKPNLTGAETAEVLALVIVHRPLFSSPGGEQEEPGIYRSWMPIGDLLAGKGEPRFLTQ